MRSTVFCAALAAAVCAFAAPKVKDAVTLPGAYLGHIQDVWYDAGEDTVYWSHCRAVVKTDRAGKILKSVDVPHHHAGIEKVGDRLFIAVCPLQNTTGGRTTPECRVWVWEYDAATLALVAKHEMEQNDRAGSLARLPDGDWLVGCLRGPGLKPNQVRAHRYSPDFKTYRGPLVWDLAKPVKLGIEVIHVHDKTAYLSIYGVPMQKLDADLKLAGTCDVNGTFGWFVADNQVWTATSRHVSKDPPRFTAGLRPHPLTKLTTPNL